MEDDEQLLARLEQANVRIERVLLASDAAANTTPPHQPPTDDDDALRSPLVPPTTATTHDDDDDDDAPFEPLSLADDALLAQVQDTSPPPPPAPRYVEATLRRDAADLFRFVLKRDDGGVYLATLKPSEADDERHLLRVGEYVHFVDGLPTDELTLEEVRQYVRASGPEVKITVFHDPSVLDPGVRPTAGEGIEYEARGPSAPEPLVQALQTAADVVGTAAGAAAGAVGEMREHVQEATAPLLHEVGSKLRDAGAHSAPLLNEVGSKLREAGIHWRHMVDSGRGNLVEGKHTLRQLGDEAGHLFQRALDVLASNDAPPPPPPPPPPPLPESVADGDTQTAVRAAREVAARVGEIEAAAAAVAAAARASSEAAAPSPKAPVPPAGNVEPRLTPPPPASTSDATVECAVHGAHFEPTERAIAQVILPDVELDG